MPLTFAQAYAIVCPDGGQVTPHSKEFRDIQELMRQSGHTTFQDTLVTAFVPKPPTNVAQIQHFHERQTREPSKFISKREWLSVAANKEAFMKHLNRSA